MLTLEEIRSRLKGYNLKQLAEASGVHYNALYRLMNGGTNPSYETVQKIVAHLDKKHGGGNGV